MRPTNLPASLTRGLAAVSLCASLLASVCAQQSQHHLWTDQGRDYGWSVDGAGDVDNDGVPDVVTCNYSQVRVLSGRTGMLIHTWFSGNGIRVLSCPSSLLARATTSRRLETSTGDREFQAGIGDRLRPGQDITSCLATNGRFSLSFP